MKVYLDMDGLLADTYGYIKKIFKLSDYKDCNWDNVHKLVEERKFFEILPKTDICDQLINKVVDIFGEYSILSTPCAGIEIESAIAKTQWIRDNLLIKPHSVFFTDKKESYATHGSILIDDYRPNITKWIEAGGIGLKFKYGSQHYTLEQLTDTLQFIKGGLCIKSSAYF